MNKEELYSKISKKDQDQIEIGNSYEMVELPQRSEDGEMGNIVLTYKKMGSVKVSAKFKDFEIRHCRAVKSIRYKDQVFNGVYHPIDDNAYFFIKRSKRGMFVFPNNPFIDRKLSMVKDSLKEELMLFVEKMNDTMEWNNLRRTTRVNKLKQGLVMLILGCIILLLSVNVFMIIFSFFLWMLSIKISNDNTTFLGSDISTYMISIFCIGGIYSMYTFFKYYKAKDKYIQFTHLYLKQHEINQEVEYWNSTIFHPLNMKVILADNFDYLEVFYENRYRVQLCNHFDN